MLTYCFNCYMMYLEKMKNIGENNNEYFCKGDCLKLRYDKKL